MIFNFLFGNKKLKAEIEELRVENRILVKSLEFHEEQWMNAMKELDYANSRLKKFEESEKEE